MNIMTIKKHLLAGLTAALLLPALAAETAVPLPVVVAESEAFEIVGRLEQNGLILHVDRAPSNAPVLAATLSAEASGQEVAAQFRPASGDYLIDDAAWLKSLRVPGEHALSFTLLAGEENDLLSADLVVQAPLTAENTSGFVLSPWRGGLLLLGIGLLGAFWGWRRMLTRRGGAA